MTYKPTKGTIEYMDATPIVFAAAQPTRQPTPAEATAIFDAVIKRRAEENKIGYTAALTQLQSEAPALINYFQTIRRQSK